MLRSMTAFARVCTSPKEGYWVVEISSFNHRFFEFSAKLPPDFYAFENRIRELVRSRIARGKITVNISCDDEQERSEVLVLNEPLAKRYLVAIGKLRRKFRVPGEISVRDLIVLPGFLTVEKVRKSVQKIWPGLERILKRAIDQAIQVKEKEGLRITKDITGRLDKICKAIRRIEAEASQRAPYYFDKVKSRLEQLLGEEVPDKDRLLREVAFLAERSDITEELVRMKSHLDLFQNSIRTKTEVGRELDFLCQEMHREINTVGSKAQLFEISQEVVFIKSEIEKIREQVQNVE